VNSGRYGNKKHTDAKYAYVLLVHAKVLLNYRVGQTQLGSF
jgi:hypothetical protein